MTRALLDTPAGPRRRRVGRLLIAPVAVAVAAVAALAVAAVMQTPALPQPAAPAPGVADSAGTSADPLEVRIAGVQAQLATTPDNSDTWSTLGTLYLQAADKSANAAYYPEADAALARSLALRPDRNPAGLGGLAALRAAQHRFAESRSLAQQALAVDPQNPTLYGTLTDADTQLGRYDEARDAAAHVMNLHPDVASITRAEYVYELMGEVDKARDVLTQALGAATSSADVAFCRYRLADLAFSNGDPAESLRQIQLGRAVDPTNLDLLEVRAKAEAALGQAAAAVTDFERVVQAVPQPRYLVEAGEYLDSVGLAAQAQQAYGIFAAQNTAFLANGVALDSDPTLFYADRGDPAQALRYGEAGLKTRPSVEMQDAYAWALLANGQGEQALTWSQKATSTGMRNALFSFHKGMIENSLGWPAAARTDLTAALTINPYFNPRLARVARATLATFAGPR